MGTYAPYGYIKDPADHNHLLIDDKVAHVVREIFDLALAGNGIAKIRKHINKQHILRPAAYFNNACKDILKSPCIPFPPAACHKLLDGIKFLLRDYPLMGIGYHFPFFDVMCTAHSIEARDLFNAVLADINRFADMAVNDERAVSGITSHSSGSLEGRFLLFMLAAIRL